MSDASVLFLAPPKQDVFTYTKHHCHPSFTNFKTIIVELMWHKWIYFRFNHGYCKDQRNAAVYFMTYNATSQWVTECDAHLCFLQNVKTSLELDINFTISQLNVAFMISIWRWPCVFRICMVDIILRWSKESNCW